MINIITGALRNCYIYYLVTLAALALIYVVLFLLALHEGKYFRIVILAVILSAGVVIWYTLMNRNSAENAGIQLELFWSYKYLLMHEIAEYRRATMLYQILQNYLLYLPFGFTLSLLLQEKLPRREIIPAVLLCALLLSCITEATQYLLHLGLCEVDDVFNNCVGALLGCLNCRALGKCFFGRRRKRGVQDEQGSQQT